MDLRNIIKTGTEIMITMSGKEIDTVVGDVGRNPIRVKHTVTDVYPHFVMCGDKTFNVGDLVMSGVKYGGAV